MTFGKRLSTLRNARQLTQGALAAALEVSQSKYNKWENDINRPDYEMVAALARYFGTTTDYLLGLDEQPARAQSDVYTLTGLEPRTVDRLRDIWQGRAEPGYIPPAIRVINDLVGRDSQGSNSVLATIAAYLNYDDSAQPDSIQVEYDGRNTTIRFDRDTVLRFGVLDALRDLEKEINA